MSYDNKKDGFGIVEVLVAAMILVAVVGATVALGSASIRSGTISGDKTVAYNLAQEGLEIVRQIRDSSWLDGNPATDWASGLTVSGSAVGGPYKLENKLGRWQLVGCGDSDGCDVISEGTPSVKYERRIYVDRVGKELAQKLLPEAVGISSSQNVVDGLFRRVRVEVKWLSANGNKAIKVESYLSDWKSY